MDVQHDADAPLDALEVDRAPARFSAAVALSAALLAAVTSALLDPFAIPFGLVGLLILAIGLFVRGSRTLVSVGVATTFAGVILGGTAGVFPGLVLFSTTATIVAWDVGRNAISVGEHLGSHSVTRRAEVVHAASTVVVSAIVVAGAYAVYQITQGGQPPTALILLVLGSVLLIWALRS